MKDGSAGSKIEFIWERMTKGRVRGNRTINQAILLAPDWGNRNKWEISQKRKRRWREKQLSRGTDQSLRGRIVPPSRERWAANEDSDGGFDGQVSLGPGWMGQRWGGLKS